jgi:hypothetical protein
MRNEMTRREKQLMLQGSDNTVIKYTGELYSADPKCKHEVVALWSGVACRKCPGWFCY